MLRVSWPCCGAPAIRPHLFNPHLGLALSSYTTAPKRVHPTARQPPFGLETSVIRSRLSTQPCTVRTAPANDNEKVDDWAESDLAWELADAISPLLADRDRAQLYATIGSGESYTAIDTVLQTMAHQSLPVAT